MAVGLNARKAQAVSAKGVESDRLATAMKLATPARANASGNNRNATFEAPSNPTTPLVNSRNNGGVVCSQSG